MLPHEMDTVCDDYELQIKNLKEHNKLLMDILAQIKARVEDTTVLVNIDIQAKEIGREVRIYTVGGDAAGIGTKVITKVVDNEDLFTKTHATYEVKLDLKKIMESK